MNYGVLSLLPIAIVLVAVFLTKNAFVSIILGLLVSSIMILLGEGDWLTATSAVADIVSTRGAVQILLFVMLTGALVFAMGASGGAAGMVKLFTRKKEKTNSKVMAQLLSMGIGLCMFVDASSSMVVTSVVGAPLFKENKIPKEKLALVANSTGAPIAWLIPFSGAGAMMVGGLASIASVQGNEFAYVVQAIPFQFYTIALLVLLFASILMKKEIGPIAKVQYDESKKSAMEVESQVAPEKCRAINMILPVLILIGLTFVMLAVTGGGDIFAGNASEAIFTAGILTLIVTMILYVAQKLVSVTKCIGWFFSGMKNMLEVTTLLLVAYAFGAMLGRLGTANYIVGLFGSNGGVVLPLITIVVAAILGFSTGTSSGTVTILFPILCPVAVATGGSLPLIMGAIVSGAVFGDQSSPISDSVILTSAVTGVEPMDHVRTQLPYTLIALGISIVLYTIFGFILF